MLRKLYRLVCFSLAFVMTVEAPAQTTPPPQAATVKKYYNTHFKSKKMNTVADFLKVAKKSMPPEVYAKHAANFKGHEKEKMPQISVDGQKILINDEGKMTTIEARDPAGDVFYINNEPFTRAEIEAVTPAMEKLTKGKPSASLIDFMMRSLVMDEAHAVSPWLIGGIALLLVGGLAWAFSSSSSSKEGRRADERKSNIDRIKQEADPRNKDKQAAPPVKISGGDPTCAYPRDVNNGTGVPKGCEISNVVEYYGLSLSEARFYFCGQGDQAYKNMLKKSPETAARQFHGKFLSRLNDYYTEQGLNSTRSSDGKSYTGPAIPTDNQYMNAKYCFERAAQFEEKACNPMQPARILVDDGFQTFTRCGDVPRGNSWRRFMLPNESPCEIYRASEASCGQPGSVAPASSDTGGQQPSGATR